MRSHRPGIIQSLKLILFFSFITVLILGFSDLLPNMVLELQNERLNVKPREFYIASIFDERVNKNNFGQMILPLTKGRQKQKASVGIKGGMSAVTTFMNCAIPADKNLRPLVISIKSLTINETAVTANRINGQAVISLSFGLQQGDTLIHLADYSNKTMYHRAADSTQQTEPIFRKMITNSLLYINNWMNEQADENVKLAKSVKIIFADYHEEIEGDTIYYHTNRPLSWADFKQRPLSGNNFAAEIFASIGYNEHTELIKGVVNIKLDVKVFAPKSACWVKSDSKNAYSLNHEQRHFDMVKLVAGHFKTAISNEKLSIHNYDGIINVAYFEALREMNRLQKQYDKETAHGVLNYQQQLWNDKIDNELKLLGIKPA